MKKYLFLITAFFFLNSVNAQLKREFQLNFDSDSYAISKENADFITAEITKIRSTFYKRCKIEITGYTDNTGSLAHNKTLSSQRAKSITDFFVSKGFSSKWIIYKGNDIKNPIADNDSEEGKARNRRVNVLITFDYNEINELKKFEEKPEEVKVKSGRDSIYIFKSGAKITVPASSFADGNGKDIDGDITLFYKEFKSPIDFILSGIPMDIEEGGKRCFFNSTGMFKVTAFKENKPVFLKKERSLTVDFKQTASLPNTNFYQLDTLAGKWNKITRITNFWGAGCYVGEEETVKCPLKSCQLLFHVQEKGLEYAKSSVMLFDLAHVTNPANFENVQRKLKNDIQKIASSEKRLPAFGPKLNNITTSFEIKLLEKDKNYALFKIECSDVKGRSNDLLKKAVWKYPANRLNDAAFEKKWPVCTVEKKDDQYYSITFKDSVWQQKLEYVTIELDKKVSRKRREKIISRGMEKINTASQEMNDIVTLYKNLKQEIVSMKAAVDTLSYLKLGSYDDDYNKDIIEKVQCFVEYNKVFMSDKEKKMSEDVWLKYFDSHKEEMINRYSDLLGTDDYKDCLAEKLAREEALREAVELDKKRNKSDQEIKDLVVPLSITSLGIYNCDIVQRLINLVIVKAQYKTEDGNSVEPYFVYLIDSNFNGIIRYDVDRAEFSPARFPYSPGSKNLLIVFDEDGKAYLFSSDKFKNLIENKMNTLILERIKSKKQLENALL